MTQESASTAHAPLQTSPFVNGADGIACYRIPSLVTLPDGTLLAACEARVANCGDHGGPIRVVTRRSTDDGATWEPMVTAARNVLPDGEESVAQNPCLVVDTMDPEFPEGRVFLLFNRTEFGEVALTQGNGVRRHCVIESVDGGRTWTNDRDITTQVHRPNNPTYTRVYADATERYAHPDDWRATFTPVGHGIQLQGGADGTLPSRGWLACPTYFTTGDHTILQGQAAMVTSRDHGQSWQVTELTPFLGVNEMMGVERRDGSVLVNFRNYATPDFTVARNRGACVFTLNADGEWDVPQEFATVPELPITRTGMQAPIVRAGSSMESPLLFSTVADPDERKVLDIWLSEDDGETWPIRRTIDDGPAAYSDISTLANGEIAVLYERGGDNGMSLAVFPLDWIRGQR